MPREEYVRTEAIRALIERDLQPIRAKWTLDMNLNSIQRMREPRRGLTCTASM